MLFKQVALTAAFVAGSLAEFYIKSTGSSIPAHNNLYVEAYHTGAGLADAVLTPNTTYAGHFFLNNTALRMDIDDTEYT